MAEKEPEPQGAAAAADDDGTSATEKFFKVKSLVLEDGNHAIFTQGQFSASVPFYFNPWASMDYVCVMQFLAYVDVRDTWVVKEGDVVMDIGCGPELHVTRGLLERTPAAKVIAIDYNDVCVKFLRERYPHPLVEYHHADISKRNTLRPWFNRMDKIVSVNSFHTILDAFFAFKNVFSLLKPGGEAAVMFTSQSGYYDFLMKLARHEDWGPFYTGKGPAVPLSHFSKYNSQDYLYLLSQLGFEVKICTGDEPWLLFTYSTISTCMRHLEPILRNFRVPQGQQQEFREFAYDLFVKENVLFAYRPVLRFCELLMVVKKPFRM